MNSQGKWLPPTQSTWGDRFPFCFPVLLSEKKHCPLRVWLYTGFQFSLLHTGLNHISCPFIGINIQAPWLWRPTNFTWRLQHHPVFYNTLINTAEIPYVFSVSCSLLHRFSVFSSNSFFSSQLSMNRTLSTILEQLRIPTGSTIHFKALYAGIVFIFGWVLLVSSSVLGFLPLDTFLVSSGVACGQAKFHPRVHTCLQLVQKGRPGKFWMICDVCQLKLIAKT